jgi:hypothetical protein
MRVFKSKDMCFCISDECTKAHKCKRNVQHYDFHKDEYISCVLECDNFDMFVNGSDEEEINSGKY